MHLLDVIHEMHMVGAAKNDQVFRGRYSFENLVHTVDRKADVVVRCENERRNVAAPLKRQLAESPASDSNFRRAQAPQPPGFHAPRRERRALSSRRSYGRRFLQGRV